MNLLDIIGPVMVGPSSSHTAGAVKIGRVSRKLMAEEIVRAEIYFHGSFLATGKGHGTDKALIFPMIFVPLGTFIMTQSFKAVSNEVIDAAKLDGCSLIQVIIRVAAPIVKGSIVCVGLLSFLDAWNMVEQPIAY